MEDDPAMETVNPLGQKEEVRAGGNEEGGAPEAISDEELDELLDQSLGEFGKHIPPSSSSTQSQVPPVTPSTTTNNDSPQAASVRSKTTPTSAHLSEDAPTLGSAEMDEIFSAEFAAEAEAQLSEAVKMLSDENPELWQQFEAFAKSMGLDEARPDLVPPPSGAASKGESSVDTGARATATVGKGAGVGGKASGGGGGDPPKSEGSAGEASTLDQKLDETIRKMQENASRLGPEGGQPEGLSEMLSQLDLGSEEGEDHFMKMMQGMMSTLLSKEVLYPSLVDLCKQYPDWLSSHQGKVPEEDYQRYCKQLEIMRSICVEFEKPGPASSEQSATSERVLELMQQLQKYGQPPEDLAGENLQQAGIPPGLQNLMSGGGTDPSNCTIM